MSFLSTQSPLQIKICGITSLADAEMAIAAGADALGFNFFSGSKRYIPLEKNQSWIAALAGRVFRVAVVVNAGQDELERLKEAGCFEAVQFHGDETPEDCADAGFPVWIRAIRVKDKASYASALRYDTPYLLLDGWMAGVYGGTGHKVDWRSAREFVVSQPRRRVILAGGLEPKNVAEAVRAVGPHAVDTASGVEGAPGHKDSGKVAEFIKAARDG
ncbi:MAG TPA: phosphoribosylanthranilate isomerase [Terrimicrobiaceae bacterium]